MNNNKTIFFILGILQIILGFSMIFPIIIQFIYNEFDSTFISSGLITIIAGILFCLANLDQSKKINLQQAFLLTSLSWISVAAFGSLPFIFSNMNFSFSDAFFESMSGITTTGSSVIDNLLITPKGILLFLSRLTDGLVGKFAKPRNPNSKLRNVAQKHFFQCKLAVHVSQTPNSNLQTPNSSFCRATGNPEVLFQLCRLSFHH